MTNMELDRFIAEIERAISDKIDFLGGFCMSDKLKKLMALDVDFLTPAQVGEVMGTDAHALRVTVREHPERIPFPFFVCGNRVKFPKIPFLAFLGVDVSALLEEVSPARFYAEFGETARLCDCATHISPK